MKQNYKIYIRDHYKTMSPQDIAKHLNIPEKSVRKFIQTLKEKEPPTPSASPAVPKPPSAPAPAKFSWKVILAIVVLGALVYSNSLHGEFIWDDNILIRKNSSIKDLSNLGHVLTSKLGGQEYHREHGSYRPLQTATYIMDYALWQDNPFGYHLTNTALHLLSAVALYAMLLVLLSDDRIAAIAALLFVAHPVHTEAVSYVAGRADSLAAIFLILSFLFYVLCSRRNILFLFPMTLSYALALLSKENSLMILIFIGVYHFAFRKKIAWPALASILALSGIYVFLRTSGALGHLELQEAIPTTLAQRVPGFFIALTTYLRILLFPFHLHMEYGSRTFPWTHPAAGVGALLFGAILFFALKARRRHPLYCFGLLWFLLGILPVSNTFLRLNAFMAEHWLYMPSIGLFLAAAVFINSWMTQAKYRRAASLLLVALIAFLGVRTFQQNVYWREPIAFFKRTLHYAPFSVRAMSDLAFAYDLKKQYEDAIRYYEKALALDPNYADAYNNLGNAYIDTGQYDKAVKILTKALTLTPDASYVYFNLGAAYTKMGKNEEARAAFEKGISLKDINPLANLFLARTYINLKEYQKAHAVYEKLIIRDPANGDYHYRLGLLHKITGQTQKAIGAFTKATELDPKNVDAFTELGIAYSSAKQYERALEAFKKILPIREPTAIDYSNLGVAYNNLGQKELAIEHHKKAIATDPAHAAAYNNLGLVYINLKKYEEAVPLLKKALELSPNYTSAMNNLGIAYQRLGMEAEAREMFLRSGRLREQ